VEAVPKLVELLESTDEFGLLLIIKALGTIGDRRALQPLIDALNRVKPAQRWIIWDTIGDIGCAEEVKHLSYLLNTPDWQVTPEDRLVLLELDSKPARPLSPNQVEKIKADIAEFTNADVKARWRAVSRLARRRGLVVELLTEATASPNPMIRFYALYTLGQIGNPRIYPVALAMTKDPNPHIRWDACKLLGIMGGSRAIPTLIEVLLNATEGDLAVNGALDGLEAIGDPALPAVKDLLRAENELARITAAYLLGHIGYEEEFDILAELLHDPNPAMRIVCMESLIMLSIRLPKKGKECLELIKRMTKDPVKSVKERAVYFYEEITG